MSVLRPPGSRKSIASLFLLPDCDMGCAFCASEAVFDVASFAQAEELLGGLRSAGFDNLVLGGGEPFLWPHDLERLGRRARELGFLVQVGSNGLSPPPGFASLDWVDRYLLPLEAAEPALHDQLRSAPGGHHRTVMARLDQLVASGKELTVGTVVTRRNLPELAAIAALLQARRAAGLNLHAWHLYRFLPVGRGGAAHGARLAVDLGLYRRAVEELRAVDLGFPVFRRDDMLRSSTVEFFWFQDGQLRVGSGAAPGGA